MQGAMWTSNSSIWLELVIFFAIVNVSFSFRSIGLLQAGHASASRLRMPNLNVGNGRM